MNNNKNNKVTKTVKLQEKEFALRNSLITDLTENDDNIRTIYHLFIAIFVGLFVNTLVCDYLRDGQIKLGLTLVRHGFKNFHFSLYAWLLYFAGTCLVHPLFILWAKTRCKIILNNNKSKVWDISWLILVILSYILSFQMVPTIAVQFHLAPASTVCLVLEQIRLLMKVHAFIRTNVPNVLKFKAKSDKPLQLPTFKSFFYFLWAPTLIYRDEYPRSKERRWSFIFLRLLEIIGTIFYLSFLINRFVIPSIQDVGIRPYSVKEIIISLFDTTLSGTLIKLAGFYVLLHSTQNLFAELLYFGDRMFYSDWWTCTSYSTYYRTWNIVVYDWLYTYIYKDFVEIIVPNNKLVGKFAVFITSAIVHEWILINIFGFFIPMLFIFYFIGAALHFVRVPKSAVLNILFLYELGLGFGILVYLYSLEFMVRLNVPLENPTIKDFFVPRFITCNCIKL